jgi:hypothetical protein
VCSRLIAHLIEFYVLCFFLAQLSSTIIGFFLVSNFFLALHMTHLSMGRLSCC